MILVLNPEEHESLLTILAHNPDAKLLKRVQIVLGLAGCVGPTELARRIGCDRSTIYRVGDRFANQGLSGLEDGRAKLRGPRVSPTFLAELGALVDSSPREHGWERSTWSLELFALELSKRGLTAVHAATIARYLDSHQVAFNRARPCLVSPDPDKAAKLAAIEKLGDRIQLHFLPSYSPEHNPIELLWKELHACVTRNHDAKTLDELMQRVDVFLEYGLANQAKRRSLARAS